MVHISDVLTEFVHRVIHRQVKVFDDISLLVAASRFQRMFKGLQ